MSNDSAPEFLAGLRLNASHGSSTSKTPATPATVPCVDDVNCGVEERIKPVFVTEMKNIITVHLHRCRTKGEFSSSEAQRAMAHYYAGLAVAAVSTDVDSGMHAGPSEVMMTHYQFHCDWCLTLQSSTVGAGITSADKCQFVGHLTVLAAATSRRSVIYGV